MQRPVLIEDTDEHERRQREEDEQRALDEEDRWAAEDRAGLGPWGARAHRVARRERARRARPQPGRRADVSSAAIADPVALVDPTGARRTVRLSPAGHVALFVRALHAPAAAALHRADTADAGLVEACAVTRGARRTPASASLGASREQFMRCGDVAALQALARDDQGRGAGVLVLGAPAHRADGRRQGGARRRRCCGPTSTAQARCGAPGRCASGCPCDWSSSLAARRIRARRAGTSTWPSRAGWRPPSSRPPTPA